MSRKSLMLLGTFIYLYLKFLFALKLFFRKVGVFYTHGVVNNWIYFQQNCTEGYDDADRVAESWEDNLHI